MEYKKTLGLSLATIFFALLAFILPMYKVASVGISVIDVELFVLTTELGSDIGIYMFFGLSILLPLGIVLKCLKPETYTKNNVYILSVLGSLVLLFSVVIFTDTFSTPLMEFTSIGFYMFFFAIVSSVATAVVYHTEK